MIQKTWDFAKLYTCIVSWYSIVNYFISGISFSRWSECVNDMQMSHAAAYVFVNKYFTKDTETRVSKKKLTRFNYLWFLTLR